MNHWFHMLADLPALGQRTIARAQRISLPRRCDAATRLARLRHALCHAATVRAVYAVLPADAQAALQHLRACPGGIRPADLAARFGPVRTWPQLAADLAPRSISEQLLLLGWLLPRPASPRHPAHFLVPPEVRRALPHPLEQPAPAASTDPATPSAPLPLAVRAATTLLLASAERAWPLTRRGALTRASLRALAPRLAPTTPADAAAVLAWLCPLLVALDLLDTHAGRASLSLAGQRWLARPPAEQLTALRSAWEGAPDPDTWLRRLRVDVRGIDWPLLRRRLLAWAAARPSPLDESPETRYAALARAFGPLADAHTHGFRTVERAPWQPRRAPLILDAAWRGPLAWLGACGPDALTASPPDPVPDPPPTHRQPIADLLDPLPIAQPYRMRDALRVRGRPGQRRLARRWDRLPLASPPDPAPPADPVPLARWRYAAPGVVLVPHAAPQAATLRLARFARWAGADATATHYQLTPSSLARAAGQGWDVSAGWELLAQHAGAPPVGWRAGLATPTPALRLAPGVLLLAETPAVLTRAATARSVRRHLTQRVAPGVALLRAEQVAPLRRALARHGVACALDPAPAAPVAHDDADLSPGERAVLLVACAYYRRHAPPDAPLLPNTGLEQRLRAGLSVALTAAVEAELAALGPPPQPVARADWERPAGEQLLARLRAALARQEPVGLVYDTGGQGAPARRTVRPLALEQRDQAWYLRAYCCARQAERTFRLDRIVAVE